MALCDSYGMASSPTAKPIVVEIEVEDGSLAASAFDQPDYRDAFQVQQPDTSWRDVDEIARAFFLGQPRWIAIVSMNLGSRADLEAALATTTFDVGTSVGSWKVYDRDDAEIVFGDDMGFMEYRFALRQVDKRTATGSTSVRYRWPRVSGFYFGLVKPFHRRFIPIAMRNMASRPPMTADLAMS